MQASTQVILFSNIRFLHALAIKCRKRSKSSPYWAGPQTLEPAGKGRSGRKIGSIVIVKLRYFHMEAQERKINSPSKFVQLKDYSNLRCSSAQMHVCICTHKRYLCSASAVKPSWQKSLSTSGWSLHGYDFFFSKEGRRKSGIRCSFFLWEFRALWQSYLPHSEKPLLQLWQ